MTLRILLTTMILIALAAPAARADASRADVHLDAIVHQVEVGKSQVDQLRTDLHVAREANRRLELSVEAWKGEYGAVYGSVAYTIGWWIVFAFRWWLIALAVAFALRLVFVYIGGPIGSVGAQVTTALLHVLTGFLTLLVNIPDNLFFRRKLAQAGVESL